MRTGGAITAAALLDVYVTKGWASRTILGTQAASLFEHNRLDPNTPQGQAQQQRFKDNATDLAITAGVGAIGGKVLGTLASELGSAAKGKDGLASELGSAAKEGLKSFSGTEKAWPSGATPNSIYTYLSGDKKIAISNYVYNSEGKVIFQVDFAKHGKFSSGHGHNMNIPGNLGSGHTDHIPWIQVPSNYLKIPKGVQYSTPVGQ